MSAGWIGLCTRDGGAFDPAGLGAAQHKPAGDVHVRPDSLLPRGTLLLETRLSPDGRPETLLGFDKRHPWRASLTVKVLPGGGFVLVVAQGDDVRHATLPHHPDGRSDAVRLSYSWDAPARSGRLTLERPENDRVVTVPLSNPPPLPLADLQEMIARPTGRASNGPVTFFALSDRVEPVGPMPGMTGRLPVATPRGLCEVRALRRGDTVLSATAGGAVPVLRAVRRTVPAFGSLRPVRLRAPYFGLRCDVMVAPEKRLVVGGADVEYLFGCEAVLVPARHLVNGVSALRATGPLLVTYHDLLLPAHEPVPCGGGAALESLFIGRIRRRPEDLAASILAGAERAHLPEHAAPAWPVLRPTEAITLAETRAA
ncbi:Hint domain-containing protein [Roseovarius salinarum]|uniref:Hint domain-containing protein n=1 Tax=Roseovarius salinarum TaxID=1981892 RepID=UPI000C31BE57|nr:Hint domain-containing protein [Roseovarius salinarum]